MPASVMIGGAAGQDAGIGGRHMGMGADDEADLAVEMMAEGLLLAGRLRMEVDQDGIGRLAEAVLRQTLERRRQRDRRGHP